MIKRSISILFFSLLACAATFAQLDSRNRTPETVITDGLAQLPAKNVKTYNEVVSEMAATGQKGIEMLAAMLKPAENNQNAVFEYAIDAIASYATRTDDAKLRKSIHDGLANGLKNCTDDANRAFLMTQLSKLAAQGDAQLFASYLGDPYLRNFAINGLALVPGDEEVVAQLINTSAAPDAELAYVAAFKRLNNVEPTLIAWTGAADAKVLAAVYNALAECGTDAAIKPLQAAAKNVNFANDPTGATDAYLRLLGRLSTPEALKAAKALTAKNYGNQVRSAALTIVLNADKGNELKNVLKALGDKDIIYRNTALALAPALVGENVFDQVAAKFKSFSPAAKVDVVNWLGNNHVASQIDLVTSVIPGNDTTLAVAGIAAASKIGGDKALAALIPVLASDEQRVAAASAALLSFNGNINQGIVKALDSADSQLVAQALELAAARHIFDAYPKTVELMLNGNSQLNKVALKGLKGVVRPENFAQVCGMLDEATEAEAIAELQAAAKNAVVSLPADQQYELVAARMAKAKGAQGVAKYYPLLAQAATGAAIDKLVADYKATKDEQAYAALMTVNSPAMIPVTYDIAANNPDKKDATLRRYIKLVKANALPPVQQYVLFANGLALQPSAKVQNELINALATGRTLPAAMLAASYLDSEANAVAAASTVKYIFGKEEGLRKGRTVKALLEKAREVFKKDSARDADSGYAADEISGMLNGYDENGGYAAVAQEGPEGEFENFDLYFDWNGVEPINVTLRSMPLLTLDPTAGVTVNGHTQAVAPGNNLVHARLVNDRIFVEVGSTPMAVNEVIVNPNPKKEAPVKGAVKVDNPLAVSNFYFNALPDTPVFTLPAEEAAQGFEVLFDGRSLEKWHGNTAAYVPVDGNIYVTARYGGTGNLYTKKNYSDFIFRFEFFFDEPAVNNGIGIRTGKDVTGVDAAFHGMEIQVLDHDDPVYQGYPFGYTGIKPYQIHGSIYGVVGAKHLDFGPIKQWHTEEIKAVGDHITVTVDGEVIVDANIREACQGHAVGPEGTKGNPYMIDHRNHPGLFNKEGFISFCGHGPGVKFRNVRVLDLSDKGKTKKKRK